MKAYFVVSSIFFLAGLGPVTSASAHEPDESPIVSPGQADTQTASTGMPVYVHNIAPAAADAVKVVDAFSAALRASRIDEASDLLDPEVLVLENGGSERSREQYLTQHAIGDVLFLQNADQQLRYRQAQAEGNVAWVGTESILESSKDGETTTIFSTETMVLRKTDAKWKIVHIHWSSRPAPKRVEGSTTGN